LRQSGHGVFARFVQTAGITQTTSPSLEHLMQPFQNLAVVEVFAGYPLGLRRKVLALRQLIFETAAKIDSVGEIEETLK
jgi:hypothetical protein